MTVTQLYLLPLVVFRINTWYLRRPKNEKLQGLDRFLVSDLINRDAYVCSVTVIGAESRIDNLSSNSSLLSVPFTFTAMPLEKVKNLFLPITPPDIGCRIHCFIMKPISVKIYSEFKTIVKANPLCFPRSHANLQIMKKRNLWSTMVAYIIWDEHGYAVHIRVGSLVSTLSHIPFEQVGF